MGYLEWKSRHDEINGKIYSPSIAIWFWNSALDDVRSVIESEAKKSIGKGMDEDEATDLKMRILMEIEKLMADE